MPRILATHPGSNPDSYPIWRGTNPFEDEQETEKLAAAIFKSRDYATYYAWTLAGLLVLHVVRYQGKRALEKLQKGEHKHKKSILGKLRLFHKIDQCLLYHPEGEGRLDVATHLVALIFMAATAVLLFYNITHAIVFGFRTGFVIAINFPLMYILGAKKTPLSFLVGWSYDQLNIFHQVVGICCVYAAIMHAAVFAYYFNPMYLITEFWSQMGIMAFVAFVLIGLTSQQKFRERYYEVFYVVHLVGMLASLVGLYFHIPVAKPFALAAGASVIYDRVARAADGYRVAKAYLELHSGDTIVVKIPKNQPRELLNRVKYRQSVWNPLNVGIVAANGLVHTLNLFIGLVNRQTKLKWHSGQHMFITFLKCRPFESHPFTISSSYEHEDTLEFIIRIRQGFTKSLKEKLLAQMETQNLSESDSRKISWTVILHGPYGVKPLGLFVPPSQDLAVSENSCLLQKRKIVLIAGGSGVAFTFPLMLQLAHHKREVEFIWIVPDRSYATWVDLSHPRVQNAAVLVHETRTHGRPDIAEMVQSRLQGSTSCDWVCVCGPDMLLRQVRNNVAELRGNGQSVELFAERFGW
ncbi:putative ferric reductase transmembrane component [Yarrowia sp. C11]|nr:putative ferric reductase transmembrane component [Yarrowia sp. E02]KAG5371832.1 putative ferric reductase transmembrane component [Yarrowia sp. C11]